MLHRIISILSYCDTIDDNDVILQRKRYMYRQKQSLAHNVLNMTEKQLGRPFLLGAWIHYARSWH